MTKQKRKRQPREFYERPTTPEEAQFAEDNLNFVYWFLKHQKLEAAEWFDVVIFGYILAVKRYVWIPDLRQYKFTTIALRYMRSTVSGERKKQRKQIKTVNLHDTLPGMENLVYADVITEENLNFVPYLYAEGEEVKITYNVQVPEKTPCGGRKCEEIIAIEEFLKSKEENMCFEYETLEEARQRSSVIWAHRRRFAKLHIYYGACKIGNCIYITKGQGNEVTAK